MVLHYIEKAFVGWNCNLSVEFFNQWLHRFWSIASRWRAECCSPRPILWLTVLPVNNRCLTFATDTYRRSPGTHQLFIFIHGWIQTNIEQQRTLTVLRQEIGFIYIAWWGQGNTGPLLLLSKDLFKMSAGYLNRHLHSVGSLLGKHW